MLRRGGDAAGRPVSSANARTSACRPETHMTTASATPNFDQFAIGFDQRDRARLHELIDEVLDSSRWSEAAMNERFEAAWEAWNDAARRRRLQLGRRRDGRAALRRGRRARPSSARRTRSWPPRWPRSAPGAEVAVRRLQPRGPVHVVRRLRGARPSSTKPRAAFLVHIGGHIAFDSEQIADYCAEHGIFLIEDCAHAHGAQWNGRKPGTYGDAGVYSLYATKTISTGEGGVLVSKRPEVLEHARGVSQLRQAHLRGPRAQLPHERVHRGARPGADRADARDRRLEERRRARASRPAASQRGSSCPRA